MSVQVDIFSFIDKKRAKRACYNFNEFRVLYPELFKKLLDEAFGEIYPGEIIFDEGKMVVVTKSMNICIVKISKPRNEIYD